MSSININDSQIVSASQIAEGFLLLNQGGKGFKNVYKDYGLSHKGFGFGGVFSDFDNDGDQDLIVNHDFGYKKTPNLLLKNQFPFKWFNDVGPQTGMDLKINSMGTAVGDYNNDGLMDYFFTNIRFNKFMVNNGVGKPFSEKSLELGVNTITITWGANFADFDHDGDLDMYLLNHQLFNPQPNKLIPPDSSGNAPAADKLYRNEGLVHNHPFFKDVSKEAGILEDGYGLGVVVTDVNKDTYPDIYVANDYLSNDKLWLNQQNGTFKNVADLATRHQSYNSMGVDAGDLNNDLLPDLMVLDMLPAVNKRKKMMALGFSPEKYDLQRRLGYQPEFSRNMLQLHQGIEKIGVQPIPIYSEIGNYAGVAETDWSWSVLMADFDNDTYKDLHITNGLAKDLTNNDFLFFTQEAQQSNYAFGGGSNSLNRCDASAIKALREKLDSYGAVSLNNVCYRNQGNMQFEDISTSVGITEKSISHGASYADFDNDGYLDLVVNNVNQEAFLLKNTLRQHISDSTHHFLTILKLPLKM